MTMPVFNLSLKQRIRLREALDRWSAYHKHTQYDFFITEYGEKSVDPLSLVHHIWLPEAKKKDFHLTRLVLTFRDTQPEIQNRDYLRISKFRFSKRLISALKESWMLPLKR